MNSCRRIACGDWRSGLTAVFSRVRPPTNCRRWSEAAPSLSRTQAAAGQQAPDSDTGEKPRLMAIDLARKLRQEKAKLQQGKKKPRVEVEVEVEEEGARLSDQEKRVIELKRFTMQLQHVHPNVLAKHLNRGVLYQDKDVVVINKPYGVPVREDRGVTSISSVLPVLAKLMDGTKVKSDSQLFPCLKLEKETAGALLLARTEEVVEHILNLNKYNQVQRKYWVIVVGVPVPSKGTIDIPIIEREVKGSRPHYKMALSPLFKMNETGDGVTKVRGHRQAQPAVTKYRVVDSSCGCSLVELQPLSEVKHQMRVHMALALACPILGDHKYSDWNKLAPQILPERVLGKLGLEQSKVRHLPLHVLARKLTLPGRDQVDISASSPVPKYFMQTINRLKLTFEDD
ncbi:pseudouridylate synthase RPUSD4, mitochondrial [Centropristis striata]|uniref:pseudouridylate synthase RPUSD4, mitochondrial n=1 Tax=Centropristis striata TaxID=184440 RepID=UPI0027E121CE|nr:pseudouridylate synthase RPUSD4, mitochondrial [Centropristis striata]